MFSFNLIILSACALVQLASGAAIPMWEYLSKDEKMSYLYSMFANQVEEFCEFSELPGCSQELLKFGLRKLKELPEDHLDTMDPYQRGAHGIIWESMMQGHEMMRTTRKPKSSTTTAKPNSYDDHSFDEDFAYSGEASAKVESVYELVPNSFVVADKKKPQPPRQIITGVPEYRYPPIRTEDKNEQPFEVIAFRREYQKAPLDGPMVVKVLPDGTPVDSEEKMVVEDEDLKHFELFKRNLPASLQ